MTGETLSSTHPLLPPTTEDDRVSWLRLLRSRRVGIVTFYRLLAEHGSAAAALDALPEVAARAGVPNYVPCPISVAEGEMRAGARAGATLVFRGTPAYPAMLAQTADAPPMFWTLGDTAVLRRPMIALVGARNASSLGTRMTRSLAAALGQAGFTIVSGLARGIDAAAHLASLDTGTVAVQAGGVDVIYPSENAGLARDMVERGGLRLSEQPIGLQPLSRHFPVRNRIISGLSQAVVVVEAAARSGSLITARAALDQGREVLAVPGHPFDARSGGCNMLIRDGARLVRGADDVAEALGLALPLLRAPAAAVNSPDPVPGRVEAPARPPNPALRKIHALHRQILDRLSPSPLAEDQLIRDLGVQARDVAPALTDLELDGKVMRQPGGMLTRIV
ncbi:MAG: DNA-processing protein DprA [Roseivivax sp.]|nr:DNA-processing protein DprA [Roseivivax sp.]